MMENDEWHMTERILNITLEILYLLTGEDNTAMKTTLREKKTPCVFQGWRTLSPIKDHEQKILELTKKIIELLTGEVPIRCQDVTVYFSMEEWEYLDGHKDTYKDIMMENHQPLISADGPNGMTSAVRCFSPLYSHDCPEDIQHVQQDHQESEDEDLINIKVEVRKLEEEEYENNNHPCKEEETPYINKDGQYIGTNAWDTCLDLPQACKIEDNIVPDSVECPITPVLHPIHQQTSDINNEKHSATTEVTKASAVRKNCKPYQCAQCYKSFTQNADLIRHSRVHTGERPFLCTDCGKCFTQKSALVYHKRIHTGERPFLCFDCGKCFAHKSILINHRRIHTGEKPFSCSDCGKCFAYKSYLVDHQRIHAGVKPHQCMECRKCFTHKSDLNRHRRVHTGETPFTCSECGKHFTQRANLAMHRKVHPQK
ncbi:uncharacterized protein ACNLHF_019612 [Anomaloglossus baeobatrachus]|uniref:uncharacterized protein LOC142311084 n=1 Tax=Anomaloglossus baeobatrachus TaxID=238106 RepID=UPI003F50C2C9